MPKIHSTAVVADGAILADDVEVGPLCYVGPNVKIGPGCRLIAQCNIDGYTTIGSNNTFFPFSSIGHPAQDHGVAPGTVSYVEIGDDNVFRENTTVHSGTKPDTKTVVGNHGMFMAGAHIAHNCTVGDHVLLINGSVLGGYVEVADRALISGLCAIHQFCRVGRLSIISGGSVFSKDVPPFMMAEGRNGGVRMINLIGLKRAGFSEEAISVVKHLYRIYYRDGLSASNAIKTIQQELPQTPEVLEFLNFCATSKKGVLSARLGIGRS